MLSPRSIIDAQAEAGRLKFFCASDFPEDSSLSDNFSLTRLFLTALLQLDFKGSEKFARFKFEVLIQM